MECNKDDALKAKEVAELKATKSDFSGAKRFALKAQTLYPEIDGLAQLLATLDVYTAAEERKNGEIDWYKVLGVEPLAGEDTIRKQYRKLALMLHPDKNKSVGAEGAFKIVIEAWTLLSNKEQRLLYDQKRNLSYIHERVPDGKSSVATSQNGFYNQNGFHNLSNCYHSNGRDRRSATRTKPFRKPHSLQLTFWTVCSSCKVHFEYPIIFLNHYLLCYKCSQQFLAYETPPPPTRSNASSTSWTSYMHQQDSCQNNMTKNSCAPGSTETFTTKVRSVGTSGGEISESNFQTGIFFKSTSFESVPLGTSGAGQAANCVQPTEEEANKRKFDAFKKADDALATGFPDAASDSTPNGDKPKRRKRRTRQEMANQAGRENGGVAMNSVFGLNKGGIGTGNFDVSGRHRFTCTGGPTPEMTSILMEKVQTEIHKKLNVWNEVAKQKTSFIPKTADNTKMEEKEMKAAAVGGLKTQMTGSKVFVDDKKLMHGTTAKCDADSDVDEPDTVTMTVPDPDFHDFDSDRTESSFGGNQVWAVYDEDDGMPRYYAMVHSVISVKPFKLRISWLNSKSNSEYAPLNWIGCGFPKTSGELRVGKHAFYRHLPSFSHKVTKWAKGTRGAVRIYPTKGDIWALYRNWSPDWNEHTPDEVIHKYDMVQVLEDYNEERGVSIVPLVKVAGFKTVFRQDLDQSKVRKIPREEMFCFSHQVPSIVLTGDESHNAPKGCLELDPAATPLELLQVKPEAHDELEETAERCNGEGPQGQLKSTKEEALVENGEITIDTGLIEDTEKKGLADMVKTEKEPQGSKLLVYKRRCFRGQMEGGRACSFSGPVVNSEDG